MQFKHLFLVKMAKVIQINWCETTLYITKYTQERLTSLNLIFQFGVPLSFWLITMLRLKESESDVGCQKDPKTFIL